MSRMGWLRLPLALASGLLLALAFPAWDAPVLPWCSLALLLLVVLQSGDRPPRWALLAGFLHGLGFYGLSLPWIYTVQRIHGGLGPAQAAAVLALLLMVLALFPAAFAWGVARVSRRSRGCALLAAPFVWVTLEFTLLHLPEVGFPWNLLGYSVSGHLGLAQLATVTGIWGLSFLVAGYNALLAWLLLARTRRAATVWLVVTAALVTAILAGAQFLPVAPAARTAHLVQPNLPQSTSPEVNWAQRHEAELYELERISVEAVQRIPGAIIWPEVPAPLYFQNARFAARAERIARTAAQPFLLGVVDWKPAAPEGGLPGFDGPFNSATLLDASGRRVFQYDKIQLVPFGEFDPLPEWLSVVKPVAAQIGEFDRGASYAVGRLDGGRFGVFICYEAIFPNLVRRFTDGGAELLVNLSNDGWFGRSAAPDQHLAMARVRAIENRRWLLRATNNGHTVSIDPYGRIRARLPTDVREVLAAPYDFRSDRTLYVSWGDWLAWLSVVVAMAAVAATWKKRSEEVRK